MWRWRGRNRCRYSGTEGYFYSVITGVLEVSGGVVGAAALGSFIGMAPLQRLHGSTRSSLLGFIQVTASTADVFLVPQGYSARPLLSRGDSLLTDAPNFDASGRQNFAAQVLQFGGCTDGMSFLTGTQND